MATGIQSGFSRTASRRSPAQPPPDRLQRLRQWFGALPARLRWGAVAALLLTGLLGVSLLGVRAASAPVSLFPLKLDTSEVREVSMELTREGVSHQVSATGEEILVDPRDQARARMQLAFHGLPRPRRVEPDKHQFPGPAEERDQNRRLLEEDLSITLRQVEGVANASVKLALPEQPNYFPGDGARASASVMLEMEPGASLDSGQVQAVVHLVAFGVPDLKPENVKVVDSAGHDLTRKLNLASGGDHQGEVTNEGLEAEFKARLDSELQGKVQAFLSGFLETGHFSVVVNSEIDTSQIEVKTTQVGRPGQGEVVVLSKKTHEEYARGTPMADWPEESQPGRDRCYLQEAEAVKKEHDVRYVWRVQKLPRLQRLSCSVAVDNLSPQLTAQVKDLVTGALGIDPARGDLVAVESFPFARPLELPRPDDDGSGTTPDKPAELPWPALLGAALGCNLLLLAAFGYTELARRPRPALSPIEQFGRTADISQLNSEGTLCEQTRVNQGHQMERISRENPGRVAELLKSTWLSA